MGNGQAEEGGRTRTGHGDVVANAQRGEMVAGHARGNAIPLESAGRESRWKRQQSWRARDWRGVRSLRACPVD